MRNYLTATILFLGISTLGVAQEAKVCMAGVPDTNCPALSSDISNTVFKTNSLSGTVTVTGTIVTKPPVVANSMVYKDVNGIISTASNTYVSNTGTANESLISVNITALNGIKIPVAVTGITPTSGSDLVKTSTGTVCTLVNGTYKNLSNLNVVGNIVTGIGLASPTTCVF